MLRISLALLVGLLLGVNPSVAEFLKTGPRVYQSSDRKSRVIVSDVVPGLFIVSGSPIDLQEFNPGSLRQRDTIGAFIHVDPATQQYTKVTIGKREYKLKSFASLLLGSLKITIDNTNPYLSILESVDSREPSVLAFAGLAEVVNASGESVAALLEANQLNQYRELIKGFSVSSVGLELDKQFFAGESIGLDLQVKHACLETNALLVRDESLEEARKAASVDEQKKILRKALKSSTRGWRQPHTIRLSVDRGAVLLFDYKIFKLSVVKKSDHLSTPKIPVCVIYPFREAREPAPSHPS